MTKEPNKPAKPKAPSKPRKSRAKKPPVIAVPVSLLTAPLSLIAERSMLTLINNPDGLRAVPGDAWPKPGDPDHRIPTYPYNIAANCVSDNYYPYAMSQLELIDPAKPSRQTKQCDQPDSVIADWVIVKVKA